MAFFSQMLTSYSQNCAKFGYLSSEVPGGKSEANFKDVRREENTTHNSWLKPYKK